MKKVLIFLSFILFFCINASAEEFFGGSDFQVNPHYEYLNIEYSKLYNLNIDGVTYEDCTDIEEASRYFIEQAKQRNSKISIFFPVDVKTSASSDEIDAVVFDSAVDIFESMGDYSEFDQNGAESDYLYYQWANRDIHYGHAIDYSNKIVYGCVTFYITWFTTPQQAEEENKKVKEILDELNVYDKDEYTQVKAIYDWLLDNAQYVDMDKYNAAKEQGNNVIYHSAYSALIMGDTVCQGYATAFYRLARELGLSCRLISGNAGGPHAWNIVRIGSYYYLVDATWDDQTNVTYTYFLQPSYSGRVNDPEFDEEEFKRFFPMAQSKYTETLYFTPNAPQNFKVTKENGNLTFDFDLDYTAQYAQIKAGDEALYLELNPVDDLTAHSYTIPVPFITTDFEVSALRMEYNSRTDEYNFHTNSLYETYFAGDVEIVNLAQDTDFTQIPSTVKTIKGANKNIKLSLPSQVNLTGDLVLDNLTLSGESTIYANGYNLTIEETVTSDSRLTVYGGKNNATLDGNTNLTILGGLYKNIFGGGNNGAVNGNTNVIVGGYVNKGDSIKDSDSNVSPCKIYGGGNNGAVSGETNVTLKDNAITLYVIGSGLGTKGTCTKTNINIQGGSVMNVYAGSTNVLLPEGIETKIIMTGGTAEALFGGCESVAMTGHTRIYLLGGHIKRRIYTGCYNDVSALGNYSTDRYVKGTTALFIGPSASINTSTSLLDSNTANTGIFIGSRTKASHSDETNTVVYLDNSYDTHNKYLGEKHPFYKTVFISFENYIIKDGLNGTVEFTTDGKLKLIPDRKYYALFNGAKQITDAVTLSQKTNTVTYEKLPFFLDTTESKKEENKETITVEITANEPAFVFTGIFKKTDGILSEHSFKEAVNGEKITNTIDTDTNSYKIFIWTNGLKPLAEPIIK